MKKFVQLPIVKNELTAIVCDVCGKEYSCDCMEIQEFLHIKFEGGYNSIFGDMALVEAEICQHCVKRLLGEYLRVTPMEYEDFESIDAFLESLET